MEAVPMKDVESVVDVIVMDRTTIADLGVDYPPRVVAVMKDGFRKVLPCDSLEQAKQLGERVSQAAGCQLQVEIQPDAFQAFRRPSEQPRRKITLE